MLNFEEYIIILLELLRCDGSLIDSYINPETLKENSAESIFFEKTPKNYSDVSVMYTKCTKKQAEQIRLISR